MFLVDWFLQRKKSESNKEERTRSSGLVHALRSRMADRDGGVEVISRRP